MSARVGIIGLGARTPVGVKAPHAAAAVRAGICRYGNHPFMIDKQGHPMKVARDGLLPPELGGSKRFQALASSALEESLSPLASQASAGWALPAVVALPDSRPGLPGALADALTHWLREDASLPIRLAQLEWLPHGHAAGLMALERGWQLIQSGRAELCLAGGIDSYLEAETLEWLDERELLKSSANRSGFIPGEGAGFCLLASARVIRQLGLSPLAWIVSAATRREEHPFGTQGINVGRGLSEAIAGATRVLGDPPTQLADTMYCDLNGEPHRSEEFTYASLRCQLAFADHTDYETPSDCWGDVGAATGPLLACLATASGRRRYARGPRPLLWASSYGGERSAVLLHLENIAEREMPAWARSRSTPPGHP
ncbi:MAG TPA: beta-ketoacyl synthase N-terminal-like domain-containing protein [Archangium sp.]|uniref:beta-ketoacyl synthase N-terminal-like domain-containing protein n=1 Tax=Archangium sp. TaxID=1872627 RepID=UPI002E35B6F7|nr:beta-ketoacyl synthase N-terminal-like domain-containing protein [Archangium sp.]HEX5748021.1 beta-ketoacyl synthase N-terminal-like domain-containing protein [Archangium sp.]